MLRPYRVVVVAYGPEPGQGALGLLARAGRDIGFEVIHGGQARTPVEVVALVVQEDADAVVLAGAPPMAGEEVAEALAIAGAADAVVMAADTPTDPGFAGLEVALDQRERG